MLFLGGILQKSLLKYLPSSNLFENIGQEEYEEPKITKKICMEFENKTINPRENSEKNPYYTKINENYYMNGPIKFDIECFLYLDVSSIEYILISSIDELFMVPFLLSNKKFKGTVYTTVPIKQTGYHIIKEFYNMINFHNQQNSFEFMSSQKRDFFIESEFFDLMSEKYGIEINEWVSLFDISQIDQMFDRISCVNYNEDREIADKIIVSAHSSGYNIGSCYWIIKKNSMIFSVITNGCFHNYRHSSLFDLKPLKDSKCDLLILANCINEQNFGENIEFSTGSLKPYTCEILEKKLVDVFTQQLIENNHNIIMPVRNMLFILDILDILYNRFAQKNANFFIISQSLDPLISYSNSNIEYLNPILQKKIFESSPETPFSAYEKLKKAGKIMFFNNIYEFQEKNNYTSIEQIIKRNTPSVYFFIDSTMRFGLSLKFLEGFEEICVKYSLVLSDPLLQCKEVFQPFKNKCKCQVIYCPIDQRFTISDVKNELLKKTLPKNILVPKKLHQQLKFPGYEENFILYEEHKEIFLEKFSAFLEEKNDFQLVFQGNFDNISFKSLEFDKNLRFSKVDISISDNEIKKITQNNDKNGFFFITNKKKNEFANNFCNHIKNKVAQEGSYSFKKHQIRKNALNESIGFVLVFENKKNNSTLSFVNENFETWIYASDYSETTKFNKLIENDFFF